MSKQGDDVVIGYIKVVDRNSHDTISEFRGAAGVKALFSWMRGLAQKLGEDVIAGDRKIGEKFFPRFYQQDGDKKNRP